MLWDVCSSVKSTKEEMKLRSQGASCLSQMIRNQEERPISVRVQHLLNLQEITIPCQKDLRRVKMFSTVSIKLKKKVYLLLQWRLSKMDTYG